MNTVAKLHLGKGASLDLLLMFHGPVLLCHCVGANYHKCAIKHT